MYSRYQIDKDKAATLVALSQNGVLDAALEALKDKLLGEVFTTQEHEFKKREEYYVKYKLVDSLKEVIQAAINNAGDFN